MEQGTFPSDPATEVGEWEDQDLDQMEANLNDLLYQACPFHPRQFIHCVNPQTEFGQLRYKCPQEGCPVYLFEDTRNEIIISEWKTPKGSIPQGTKLGVILFTIMTNNLLRSWNLIPC